MPTIFELAPSITIALFEISKMMLFMLIFPQNDECSEAHKPLALTKPSCLKCFCCITSHQSIDLSNSLYMVFGEGTCDVLASPENFQLDSYYNQSYPIIIIDRK